MDVFAAARATARHWRSEALANGGGDVTAQALIASALRLAGLATCAVADDDSCLTRTAQRSFDSARLRPVLDRSTILMRPSIGARPSCCCNVT